MRSLKKTLFVIPLVVLLSCAGLHFNQQSFDDDNRIKTEAMALIKKSNESYATHATEVDKLKADVIKAYEREKKRKMNRETIAMWGDVINSKGNLFNLFDLWKENDQLSPVMTDQAGIQIERLLNSISDLEDHKRK